MLTNALADSNFSALTYNRNAGFSSLRAEPARYITGIPEKGNPTAAVFQDKVTLSADGMEKSQQSRTSVDTDPAERDQSRAQLGKLEIQALSPAEEQMLRELQNRDREVKSHEQAHLAAAGRHARGGPTYTYQQGPDGRRYAVGGEVNIDTSKEKTPEETIDKMQTVRRAAMAPASPSAADRAIAAAATATEAQARQELQAQQAEEMREMTTSPTEHSAPESVADSRSVDITA
ncbi:putative metalloprotease CJM1_0395 family protein [Desulfobulbus alkaliphilus]|uniref:putative metalloprotease CJM1_0395 family protein n=1 Tax=Desulfobulbus alkaliphilus TaxID=869814 RepID=UPI0019633C8F|nr:putative metalloprotease CJM1_0395 family protein [Desulfobulbus alkaliphilus]MBM9537932.1 hypothetical protein [Desulfobulbus alkaliphilus]